MALENVGEQVEVPFNLGLAIDDIDTEDLRPSQSSVMLPEHVCQCVRRKLQHSSRLIFWLNETVKVCCGGTLCLSFRRSHGVEARTKVLSMCAHVCGPSLCEPQNVVVELAARRKWDIGCCLMPSFALLQVPIDLVHIRLVLHVLVRVGHEGGYICRQNRQIKKNGKCEWTVPNHHDAESEDVVEGSRGTPWCSQDI